MEITAKQAEGYLRSFFDRCAAAERAGGLRHTEVVERGLKGLPGYHLDHETYWWIPDGVELFPTKAVGEG